MLSRSMPNFYSKNVAQNAQRCFLRRKKLEREKRDRERQDAVRTSEIDQWNTEKQVT